MLMTDPSHAQLTTTHIHTYMYVINVLYDTYKYMYMYSTGGKSNE